MVRKPSGKSRGRRRPHTGKVAGKSRSDCRWFLPVLAELNQLFPKKFPEHVAAITNRHVRVVEKWKAGRGAPDGEALAALLNSAHGDALFLALTRHSPHAWRAALNRQIEMVRLREQQRETVRRLDALERGDE